MSQFYSRVSAGRVAKSVGERPVERTLHTYVASTWVRRALDNELPTLSRQFSDVAYAYRDRSNS